MFDLFDLMSRMPGAFMQNGIQIMARTLTGMEAFLANAPSPPNLPPSYSSPEWDRHNPDGLTPYLPFDPEQKNMDLVQPVVKPYQSQGAVGIPATLSIKTQPKITEKSLKPKTLSPEHSAKEVRNMSESFSDKNVTTVQFQILFIKRDFETILQDERTVVTQHLSGDGFVAWRIADFISSMTNHGIPLTRSQANTLGPLEGTTFKPPYDPCDKSWPPAKVYLVGMSSDNNQFLRVEYQTISAISREDANYDEDQTKALQDIARRMTDPCDAKKDNKGAKPLTK